MKLSWKIVFIFIFSLMLFIILSILLIYGYGQRWRDPKITSENVPSPNHPGTIPYAVDNLLDKLEDGVIAFNAPSKINFKDSFQIQLLLTITETVEKLKKYIAEEGKKIVVSIRVSDLMEARLTGYMFQIAAITSEIPAVSKNQKTEWKWEIHPKKEGTHSLHLTLTALFDLNGNLARRTIRTFDENIEVYVTKTQKFTNFFKNNWKWLWASILVPIVGWIWRSKRTVKKAN